MHLTTFFYAGVVRRPHSPKLPLSQNGFLKGFLERQFQKVIRLVRWPYVLVETGRAPIPRQTGTELDEVAHPFLTWPEPPSSGPGKITTYAELQQQIHHALRVQHPEWVRPDGDAPLCDAYEARLAELLRRFTLRVRPPPDTAIPTRPLSPVSLPATTRHQPLDKTT